MRRVFLFGIVCSALASIVIIVGDLLNLHLQNVMLGIAGGAILGLVRTHSPAMRYLACIIGFVLGFIFYVIRLAVLPATIWGNLVAVVVTIMLVTTVSALSRDRVPMWGMLVGVAMFAGAFDGFFTTTPWLFVDQSIATAAAMMFAVTAGFMVSIIVELRVKSGAGTGDDPMAPAPAPADSPAAAGDTSPTSDNATTQDAEARSLSAVGLSTDSETGDKQ